MIGTIDAARSKTAGPAHPDVCGLHSAADGYRKRRWRGRRRVANADRRVRLDRRAYQVAEVYAFRQQVDNAFEWLERAYVQRDPGVTHSATDSFLLPLHGDPRWRPFVQRLGFA